MIEIKTFIVGFLETNCYLIYNRKSKTGFLIDPGIFDKRIAHAIDKEKISVESIINTHGHPDHTSGNERFGYPVLIHEKDAGLLRLPAEKLLRDGDIIEKGGLKLEVIHTPGHTPGSISLKLGNKIFTGDTLFCGGVGRCDLPGGSEEDLMYSIKKRLMAFSDEVEIFPGHGPSSTIGQERKSNPFL